MRQLKITKSITNRGASHIIEYLKRENFNLEAFIKKIAETEPLIEYDERYLLYVFQDFTPCMGARMPLYEKRSVEEMPEMLIKDMKNIGSIYNVNLLKLLPNHLIEEYDYPFCDIADFERQSIAAVKQFFTTDAERIV